MHFAKIISGEVIAQQVMAPMFWIALTDMRMIAYSFLTKTTAVKDQRDKDLNLKLCK